MLTQEQIEHNAEKTERYLDLDLHSLCVEAAMVPICSLQENILGVTADQLIPVCAEDFDAALVEENNTIIQ